ncbi:proteinase [Pseudonocardia sp. HH130630-07]|nr:proteinase [Pseudonocardia sp. HH130630-07]
MSRGAAVLAASVLLLTGCTGAASSAPSGPPAPVPAPIEWSECGPNRDCATVEVPVEYTEPAGETIPIAVVRHRATDPAQRIGTLFFNPGGPGVPATEQVQGIDAAQGTGMFSPAVLARFDVVGMDPRGVGASGEVRCLTDEQRAARAADDLDPAVPGGKPLPELQADAAEFAAGCAAHQSPQFLASLSTDNVARDMDQVRAAIGEEQITFYGVSYGTVVGPTYATLFPDRVRQMVIDAPVDTELWRTDPLALLDDVDRANEATLAAWFDTCRAEGVAACPFGAGDPEAAFDALVARLEANPLQVPPVEGLTPGGTLDGAVAIEAVRSGAGARFLWPTLTAGLTSAEQGDGTLLHFLVTLVSVSPFGAPLATHQESHNAVRCMDWQTPTDIAAHTTAATRITERGGRMGYRAAYSALNCAQWPVRNEDRIAEPLTGAGAPPILVVGGRVDPVSPHHWAEAMAGRLESAVLLTREGVGHGSYRTSGGCVDAAVDATLIDGNLPADGTVCTPDDPGTTKPAAGPGQ